MVPLYSITIKQKTLTSRFVGGKMVANEETFIEVTTHDLPLQYAMRAKEKFSAIGQFVSMMVSQPDERISRRAWGDLRAPTIKHDGNRSRRADPVDQSRFAHNKGKNFDQSRFATKTEVPKKEVLGGDYADLVNTMMEPTA